MPTPRATVLIGFAEALAAPEVAWSLVDHGFRVIAFARRGRSCALRHSRYVECREICAPETDLQSSLAELQSLLAAVTSAGTPRVLLPLDDKAVWLGSRTPLAPPWLLAGPSGANAHLALNKCSQVQAALDAGFHVPESRLPRSAAEVLDRGQSRIADHLEAFRMRSCLPGPLAGVREVDLRSPGGVGGGGERVGRERAASGSALHRRSRGRSFRSGHSGRRARLERPSPAPDDESEGLGIERLCLPARAGRSQAEVREVCAADGLARAIHDRVAARRRRRAVVRRTQRKAMGQSGPVPASGAGISGVAGRAGAGPGIAGWRLPPKGTRGLWLATQAASSCTCFLFCAGRNRRL